MTHRGQMQMLPEKPRQGRPAVKRAFTLVEVTIAIGICATGLLITVALLSSSLTRLTEASDRNAYARIKQSISARYAMMDWSLLEERARSGAADRFYFDLKGSEAEGNTFDSAYAADVRVGQRRTLSGDNNENRFLRMLEIRVTNTPQRKDALTDPKYHDTLTASLGNEAKLKYKYRD